MTESIERWPALKRVHRRARLAGRSRWPLLALLVGWALAWYFGAQRQWSSQTWLWFAAAGYAIIAALIVACLLASYWREEAERELLDAQLDAVNYAVIDAVIAGLPADGDDWSLVSPHTSQPAPRLGHAVPSTPDTGPAVCEREGHQ